MLNEARTRAAEGTCREAPAYTLSLDINYG